MIREFADNRPPIDAAGRDRSAQRCRTPRPSFNGTSSSTGWSCNDEHVTPVTRLVIFVDVDVDVDVDVPRRMSVSARHEAVLVGGGRVLLLDDRGWSTWARPTSGL